VKPASLSTGRDRSVRGRSIEKTPEGVEKADKSKTVRDLKDNAAANVSADSAGSNEEAASAASGSASPLRRAVKTTKASKNESNSKDAAKTSPKRCKKKKKKKKIRTKKNEKEDSSVTQCDACDVAASNNEDQSGGEAMPAQSDDDSKEVPLADEDVATLENQKKRKKKKRTAQDADPICDDTIGKKLTIKAKRKKAAKKKAIAEKCVQEAAESGVAHDALSEDDKQRQPLSEADAKQSRSRSRYKPPGLVSDHEGDRRMGSAATSNQERAKSNREITRLRSLLRGVYERNNPTKLGELKGLFSKDVGTLRGLYQHTCEKYGEDPQRKSANRTAANSDTRRVRIRHNFKTVLRPRRRYRKERVARRHRSRSSSESSSWDRMAPPNLNALPMLQHPFSMLPGHMMPPLPGQIPGHMMPKFPGHASGMMHQFPRPPPGMMMMPGMAPGMMPQHPMFSPLFAQHPLHQFPVGGPGPPALPPPHATNDVALAKAPFSSADASVRSAAVHPKTNNSQEVPVVSAEASVSKAKKREAPRPPPQSLLDGASDHQARRLRELIWHIYTRRKPGKLGTLEALLTKYAGTEREVYEHICEKYGELPDPTSVADPAVVSNQAACAKGFVARKASAPAPSPSMAKPAGMSGAEAQDDSWDWPFVDFDHEANSDASVEERSLRPLFRPRPTGGRVLLTSVRRCAFTGALLDAPFDQEQDRTAGPSHSAIGAGPQPSGLLPLVLPPSSAELPKAEPHLADSSDVIIPATAASGDGRSGGDGSNRKRSRKRRRRSSSSHDGSSSSRDSSHSRRSISAAQVAESPMATPPGLVLASAVSTGKTEGIASAGGTSGPGFSGADGYNRRRRRKRRRRSRSSNDRSSSSRRTSVAGHAAPVTVGAVQPAGVGKDVSPMSGGGGGGSTTEESGNESSAQTRSNAAQKLELPIVDSTRADAKADEPPVVHKAAANLLQQYASLMGPADNLTSDQSSPCMGADEAKQWVIQQSTECNLTSSRSDPRQLAVPSHTTHLGLAALPVKSAPPLPPPPPMSTLPVQNAPSKLTSPGMGAAPVSMTTQAQVAVLNVFSPGSVSAPDPMIQMQASHEQEQRRWQAQGQLGVQAQESRQAPNSEHGQAQNQMQTHTLKLPQMQGEMPMHAQVYALQQLQAQQLQAQAHSQMQAQAPGLDHARIQAQALALSQALMQAQPQANAMPGVPTFGVASSATLAASLAHSVSSEMSIPPALHAFSNEGQPLLLSGLRPSGPALLSSGSAQPEWSYQPGGVDSNVGMLGAAASPFGFSFAGQLSGSPHGARPSGIPMQMMAPGTLPLGTSIVGTHLGSTLSVSMFPGAQ